jgi:hypothetical protein
MRPGGVFVVGYHQSFTETESCSASVDVGQIVKLDYGVTVNEGEIAIQVRNPEEERPHADDSVNDRYWAARCP